MQRILAVFLVGIGTLAATGRFASAAGGAPPEPVPIPGGIQIPGGPLIHVFGPGPPPIGQGIDVEPGVIADFNGFSAMAYLAGSATDGQGNRFDMQTDMRVYRGVYVAADGSHQHGTFGFV